MTDGWVWLEADDGVLRLPSGVLVRGRSLRAGPPSRVPQLALHLDRRPPHAYLWEVWWLAWRDFRRPTRPAGAVESIIAAWRELGRRRVEVTCAGGRGRTGTVLACFAALDGLPPAEAIRYVRRHYRRAAVETPGQRGLVAEVAAHGGAA